MVRKDLYITKEQNDFFKENKLNFSEHVRQAIDAYIDSLRAKKVSASQSKGGNNE